MRKSEMERQLHNLQGRLTAERASNLMKDQELRARNWEHRMQLRVAKTTWEPVVSDEEKRLKKENAQLKFDSALRDAIETSRELEFLASFIQENLSGTERFPESV